MNFYQPMQQFNPYAQRMDYLHQFQQSMLPTQMSGTNQYTPLGKVVESMDIVKVTDIPMDGNIYYFPKADGTEIYSKQFMSNGQTRILTYKPYIESESNNVSESAEKDQIAPLSAFMDTFKEQLDLVNKKIDKIEKYLKPTPKGKEVETDV